MKRILIVEDDPLITRIYQDLFQAEGFKVDIATDGQNAIETLNSSQPDVVLLDLMLPKVPGLLVLRHIRSQPATQTLPVIVLSNAFLSKMVDAARKGGADECLTKAECSPERLVSVVRARLAAATPLSPSPVETATSPAPVAAANAAATHAKACRDWLNQNSILPDTPEAAIQPPLAVAPTLQTPALDANMPVPIPTATSPTPTATPVGTIPASLPDPPTQPLSPVVSLPPASPIPAAEAASILGDKAIKLQAEIRQSVLNAAPQIVAALRRQSPHSVKGGVDTAQLPRLFELYQTVHSLTGNAAIAGFTRVAPMSAALEVLLKELFEEPENINASVIRTVAKAVECLDDLFEQAAQIQTEPALPPIILVIDDEVLSRRAVCSALEMANLRAISLDDPNVALKLLAENHFDLIFLDVEMPGKTGFDLCSELRALPANKTTPVIFVTGLTGFEARARSTLSGATDIIAKPFLLIELAVKALTHLHKKPNKE